MERLISSTRLWSARTGTVRLRGLSIREFMISELMFCPLETWRWYYHSQKVGRVFNVFSFEKLDFLCRIVLMHGRLRVPCMLEVLQEENVGIDFSGFPWLLFLFSGSQSVDCDDHDY